MSARHLLAAPDPSRAAEDAVAMVLRQRLLRAARDYSSVQDHLDCAALADAADLREQAELLRKLARLRLGFASECDEAVKERVDGQWSPPISLATAELKVMLAATRVLEPLPAEGPDLVTPALLALTPPMDAGTMREPSASAVEALHDTLRAPYEPGAIATLAAVLDRLGTGLVRAPSVDLAASASSALTQLIDAFVLASLQQFLRWRHDLAHAPLGSAELLHLAARLHPAGLGAYGVNLSYIVRDALDLLALLEAAATDEPLDPGEQDRWLILFATCMPSPRLNELVDELADVGRMRALWGIFAVALRRANGAADALDIDLLLRLRDAGLDNGDMRLAIETQRIVASRLNETGLEWRILGDILATAGDVEAAEVAYEEALGFAHGDNEVRLHLEAMRANMFAPFLVLGGYGGRSWRRGSHQRLPSVEA